MNKTLNWAFVSLGLISLATAAFSSYKEMPAKDLNSRFVHNNDMTMQSQSSDLEWQGPMASFTKQTLGLLPSPNGKNFAFSPISFQLCLAMLGPGLSSADLAKLSIALNSPPDLLTSSSATKDLISDYSRRSTDIANSIWFYSKNKLNPRYRSSLIQNFGASAHVLEHLGSEGASEINQWISNKTKNRIPSLFDSLDSHTKLVLVNTVTFDGEWQTEFKHQDTRNSPFYPQLNDRQSSIQVPTMHGKMFLSATEGHDCTIAQFPYKKIGFEMDILLPNNGIDPWETLKNNLPLLDSNSNAAFHAYHYEVAIPKFEMTSKISLGSTMAQLGLGSFFQKFENPRFLEDPIPLQISDALQKVYVKVDEKGTQAAAATGMIIRASAIIRDPGNEHKFIVDRPFAFVIRDQKLGTISFMGVVYNPQ